MPNGGILNNVVGGGGILGFLVKYQSPKRTSWIFGNF